jgi:hypothetical protein
MAGGFCSFLAHSVGHVVLGLALEEARPAHSSQHDPEGVECSTRRDRAGCSPLATSGATLAGLAKTTPATVWQRRFCPRAVPKSELILDVARPG